MASTSEGEEKTNDHRSKLVLVKYFGNKLHNLIVRAGEKKLQLHFAGRWCVWFLFVKENFQHADPVVTKYILFPFFYSEFFHNKMASDGVVFWYCVASQICSSMNMG